ncbi:hypothetical protein E4T56_gene17088, partial [Termitomyces sp. T112]
MAGGVAIVHRPCRRRLIERGQAILGPIIVHDPHRAVKPGHMITRARESLRRCSLGQQGGNLRQFLAGRRARHGFLFTLAQAGGQTAGHQRDHHQHHQRNRIVRPVHMETEIGRQEEVIIGRRPGQRRRQPRPQPSARRAQQDRQQKEQGGTGQPPLRQHGVAHATWGGTIAIKARSVFPIRPRDWGEWQKRPPGARTEADRTAPDEEGGSARARQQARLTRQIAGHVDLVHIAIAQLRPQETLVQPFKAQAVFRLDIGRGLGFDRQHDVGAMQRLVMLEIMQQRRRGHAGILGQEHRRPLNQQRRAATERLDQFIERHALFGGALQRHLAPAQPCGNDHPDHPGHHQRHPAAFGHAQHVGAEEEDIKRKERYDQQGAGQRIPAPVFPRNDEGEAGGHHHGAGHGNAIGRRHRAARTETEDKADDAQQQHPVDAGHIDLSDLMGRGLTDDKARHQAQSDRLLGQRIGAGDDGLAGDDRGHRGQHHQRRAQGIRRHQEEPVGILQQLPSPLRLGQSSQRQRALPQIIERQSRPDEGEPAQLDRLPPEMAHVGNQCLGPGHGQEHRAQHEEARHAMPQHEIDRPHRVESGKHIGRLDNMP